MGRLLNVSRNFLNQTRNPPTTMADKNTDRMEKIVSLCKRRGFIFQAGEIYGGLNGCWDYGPLGVELKRNLKEYWWRRNVQMRDDIEGLDGSILTHQAVLTASGHVGGFSDPLCICLLTGERLRADQVPAQSGFVFEFTGAVSSAGLAEIEKASAKVPEEAIKAFAAGLASGRGEEEILAGLEGAGALVEHLQTAKRAALGFRVLVAANEPGKALKVARQFYERRGVKAPWPVGAGLVGEVTDSREFNPSNGGQLSPPRQFNLMFQTTMGASAEENDPNAVAYLRPETAQSIFVQFKNVLDTSRQKLPFGIAQIGKAFRNEINPRNFTFRSREFEQMEIEYFCRPEDGLRLTDEWLEERLCFYEAIGIPRTKLHILDVPDGERAFYSSKTYDIEYEFPFGVQELEGIAYRTDYDLGVHQKGSGKPLEYFDEENRERFLAHVVEPSAGCDRTVLAVICEAYDEEVVPDEKGKEETRVVMRFHPRMAPVKAAVFPLLKKNEDQVRISKEIVATLRPFLNVFYDESGAVGRRYRRQDEAGTPFCITVDFDTLGENGPDLKDTVTVRDRDSMKQERLPVKDLLAWLLERVR